MLIYIINTYKNHLITQKKLDKDFDKNNYYNYFLNILTFCMVIILIIGNIEYYNYKRNEFKEKFDLIKYIFGINKCKKKNKNIKYNKI